MSDNDVVHVNPIKGLQLRTGQADFLIKQAKSCNNCSMCKIAVSGGKPAQACIYHNCVVSGTEWCKHHKPRG